MGARQGHPLRAFCVIEKKKALRLFVRARRQSDEKGRVRDLGVKGWVEMHGPSGGSVFCDEKAEDQETHARAEHVQAGGGIEGRGRLQLVLGRGGQ